MFKDRTTTGKIIGYSSFILFLIWLILLIEDRQSVWGSIFLVIGLIGIFTSNFFRKNKYRG